MITLTDNHKIVAANIIVGNQSLSLDEKVQGNNKEVRCHFFTKTYGDFVVTLRLDWKDLDRDGNPTLDADIKKDGKDYKLGRKQWHHTLKTFENGSYLYVWTPQVQELKELSVELEFKLQTTNARTISGKARIIAPKRTPKLSQEQIKQSQKVLESLLGKTDET